jgi:hypothetical protein
LLANEKELTFNVFFFKFYSVTVSGGLIGDLGTWDLELMRLGTALPSLPELQNLFAT